MLAGLSGTCRFVDAGQGKINAMLETIFGIRTGFLGKLVSNLARMRLADVVDDANDKHMQPWADLCAVRTPPSPRGGTHADETRGVSLIAISFVRAQEHGIHNTPLTPYIDKELLQHNHLYIDGSRIQSTGFQYKYPTVRVLAAFAPCTKRSWRVGCSR